MDTETACRCHLCGHGLNYANFCSTTALSQFVLRIVRQNGVNCGRFTFVYLVSKTSFPYRCHFVLKLFLYVAVAVCVMHLDTSSQAHLWHEYFSLKIACLELPLKLRTLFTSRGRWRPSLVVCSGTRSHFPPSIHKTHRRLYPMRRRCPLYWSTSTFQFVRLSHFNSIGIRFNPKVGARLGSSYANIGWRWVPPCGHGSALVNNDSCRNLLCHRWTVRVTLCSLRDRFFNVHKQFYDFLS